MQKVFLTKTHYVLVDLIRLISTEINRLLYSVQTFPDDRNFEAKMNCIDVLIYLQKVLVGQVEDTPPQQSYDHVTEMVSQLHNEGFINILKEPIEILNRRTLHRLPQEVNLVEDHIVVHEEVERIATMNDDQGIPELGITEQPKKKKKSKIKV